MAISIIIIAVISAIFLFSTDVVESRVLLTLVGVGLVLISFFGALGFGLILGIKININIAWTLPFIILGLGVDDMYIVLISIKERKGYTQRDFITAMKEVITPVTMTSLVNGAMFAIMNMGEIAAATFTKAHCCWRCHQILTFFFHEFTFFSQHPSSVQDCPNGAH